MGSTQNKNKNNTMRYILDIAQTDETPAQFMQDFCETMGDRVVTIVCIDETNDNQFHNDTTKNTLTEAQLQRYSDYCHCEDQTKPIKQ
jgi:Tfp pilus assembly protein PilV